jgi:hypothetical protein
MSLATTAISWLGGTGTASSFANELSWTDTHESITFVVNQALVFYGDGTAVAEAAATDTLKINALLEYCLWKQVLSVLGTGIDYMADGDSFKMNQMFQAAKSRFEDAENKAYEYLPSASIKQGRVDFPDDPYDVLVSHSR